LHYIPLEDMDPASQPPGAAATVPLTTVMVDVPHSDRFQLYVFIQKQATLELVRDATTKKYIS